MIKHKTIMNNNLEFENEDPSPDSIEDNHPRTNYGEGYGGKETLKETAERLYPINSTRGEMEMLSKHQLDNSLKQKGFIEGYKLAQERMYSEEEVIKLIRKAFEAARLKNKAIDKVSYSGITGQKRKYTFIADEWFKQFKK